MPVTDGGEKVINRIPCTYYPVRFQKNQGQKDQGQVRALLDSVSKGNAISLAYVKRLDFKTQKIYIRAQKIDGSTLEIFGIVIANFQIEDKGGRPRFFQEFFLVANT